MTLLDAALAYAARGWPVLPLLPGGKRPLAALAPRGLKDATLDPEVIRAWWAKWPAANVAVRCDRLSVVDVDPRNGGEVPDDLPETYTVATGGGGVHLYFDAPDGGSKGKLSPGVDLQRGAGCYVVAPPSVTDAPYELVDARPPAPWVDLPIAAEAPSAPPAAERTPPSALDRLRAELLVEAGSTALPEARRAQLRAIALGESFADPGERDNAMTSVTAALAARFPTEPLATLVELMHASLEKWGADRLPAERGKALEKLASARRKFPPSDDLLAGEGFDWSEPKDPTAKPPRAFSDDGNALLLVDHFGGDLRYCVPQKRWYRWSGVRWVGGDEAAADVTEAARRLGRELITDPTWARKSQDHSRIAAAANLARSDVRVRVAFEALDPDPMALNVANGTLDLRTGVLEPHGRAAMATKLAPVDFVPEAQAPLWAAFLERVIPDAEVRAYLQRFAGYCLTGSTTEQCVHFLIGPGANGKSVFLDSLTAMLGDYATIVPAESLASSRTSGRAKGGASPDVARLAGVRLAVGKESEGGAELAEAMLKDVTGGELVTARELYSGFVNFRPQCKIVLGTNYPPAIKGADEGIWRRLRRINFGVRIPEGERDRSLGERIRAEELPGVLNWALAGLADIGPDGLRPPRAVLEALKDYRASEDRLGAWLAAEAELGDDYVATFGELYSSFSSYSSAEGFGAMSRREFASQLDARELVGRASWPGMRGAVRRGVRLIARGAFGVKR